MRSLAFVLAAGLALFGCDRKDATTYAQHVYVVAGKSPVTFMVDGQSRTVAPGKVDNVSVPAGKHHFEAKGTGNFALELDLREGDELVVPVSTGQCFSLVDSKKQKLLRRQARAEPFRRAHAPVVGSEPRTSPLYVAQFPCEAGDISDADLYTALTRGVFWEDLLLPGGTMDAPSAGPGAAGPGDRTVVATSNEGEAPPTAEEETALASRRPALDAYLKLVDAACGMAHVVRLEGRSPSGLWVKDGRIAVLPLGPDAVTPPAGKPAAAKAKKLGAAVKAALNKSPPPKSAEVLTLADLQIVTVDRDTTETFSRQFQGVARESYPVRRKEGGEEAVIFLYRLGPTLWVTSTMKNTLTGVGVDLATHVTELERVEAAAMTACVAQMTKMPAGSCSTKRTDAEAAARLHRLIASPPITPLYVQLLVDPRTNDSELRLFQNAPPKLSREQSPIGFNLKVSMDGLYGE